MSKQVCRTSWVSILTVTLFCSVALSGFAQSRTLGVGPGGRFYPVHDFRNDFVVHDETAKAYVPYIDELHADQTALSAFVDLESNRHYSLLIAAKQGGYLFINAALKRKLRADEWQVLSIDSLYRLYRQPEAARSEIFITLYGVPGLDDKQVFIGQPISTTQKTVVLRDDNLSVRPRPHSVYINFLGIGLLFLLATHAYLYTFYRRAFYRFFSLRDFLSLRSHEDSFLINRPLSSTNVLFTLNLSFVIGYMIIFLQSRNVDVFASRTLLFGEQQLKWIVSEFFVVSALAFIALLGKYLALEVLGGLYKLKDIINIHFFKALQSSVLFFTFLTLLLAVIGYNTSGVSWASEAFFLPLLAFYMARMAWLYIVIRSIEPIKNLYLFSYLCIVELIPLIVGLRFAL